MQKLRFNQNLTHRLSPQKLQLIKLLQVPAAAMKSRIEQELARNPALEEANDSIDTAGEMKEIEEEEGLTDEEPLRTDGDDYQPYTANNMQQQDWLATKAQMLTVQPSLAERLLQQLNFLQLGERQHKIGAHLIGSIEEDGYIRRDLEAIVNDLAFTQYIETSVQEVEVMRKKIQQFDPPGIGARSLQECLLVQLEKRKDNSAAKTLALRVLTHCFDSFARKHYEKISDKLGIKSPELLKKAVELITHLAPKPVRIL